MKKLTIVIDFDGVVVTNAYPYIGKLMYKAEMINEWCKYHTIIINTCRSGVFVEECKNFLYANGIKYHYINENSEYLIRKYGSDTRKISGDLYFDDRNMGGFCGWGMADAYVRWFANRKPVIFAIVGESGAGKTSLADLMETHFGLHQIESYTTRPKRTENETGHTFISKEEFAAFKREDMIAYTVYGEYEYCCLKKDVSAENTYVLSEDAVQYVTATFPEYDVKTIRCMCAESERRRRVGDERVDRDKDRFKLHRNYFDFLWETDSWRDSEYYKNKKLTTLHNFVMKSLNRGWN